MKTFTILATLSLCAFAFGANIDHSNKIVGGENASPGQFPYIVSLRRSTGSHACGGTILNKRTIVTAAHCNVRLITILAGTTTLNSGGTSYTISKFIPHPDFDYSTLENDVAVVILENDIEFNEFVQSLPLASSNIGDNVSVTASGWGYTTYPGTTPNDLKWIELKTLSLVECQKMEMEPVFDSQICTLTKKGEGICSGDSGGPLVVDGELVGITSAAHLCALGYPDFYTRVHSFKSWIQEHSVE